ncbi:low affinity potassium transporter [Ophidiomyces ophidiicola]|uniref:Low affinity potassium transporter n=1 Tax=Ophidiomyces ophidiicola TaxID=1387563 RepID=A0ACB8V4C8_9EURO|nr:low affinity potassium transporter [Ophidiomyces ophidiicola]KAI1952733.1 low affinity potassium transporter [Ophidiomyces ophidiicola]KAI1954300.1 low affinity potassium transporter [Ophidiomyces ophidiicola]KAI1975802.1 low affinity potassium transporter [Ophidiomyces ophidiicola]KAI2012030.1 low affinity potassium transporter [Ophidiomyces ophidiicola]KAI2030125.1 low affinity potassium transporter [Ophidiomyces ophidiicola]
MSTSPPQKAWQSRAASSISRFASRSAKTLGVIKSKVPWIRSLQLNFIFFHYIYIIGVSIIGSIYLYPGGHMSYTDALFLSVGAATQSGLNTIDLNLISTYQQVGLWLGSMISNPIVIHSSVVFIRLRSFEKRFQHVVREAKLLRRTRSRTRSRAVTTDGDQHEIHRAEMGVRGRKITVVRNSEGQALGHTIESSNKKKQAAMPNGGDPHTDQNPSEVRQAAVLAEAAPICIPTDNQPQSRLDEDDQPTSFVNNQRRQSRALRIPSPREFDRGGVPEAVDVSDTLTRRKTSPFEQVTDTAPLHHYPSPGQHITIDEPNTVHPRRATTFPPVQARPTAADNEDEEPTAAQRRKTRKGTLASFLFSGPQSGSKEAPYLSWQPTVGRNSAFVDLSEQQKDELGGIEYRALKTLAWVLAGYFFFFHMLGIVSLVPWILHTRWGRFPREAGVGRPWWAVFISGSAFNDQGFSLTPNSLLSFYDAIFPVLLLTFLIIIGNTGFPCMLRFIIWVFWKIFPKDTAISEELHFLLDHPRRCFTLLFPSKANWWLFWVLVLLNGLDLLLFIILDLNDPDVTSIPGGIRFVDGLFQAAATRTAGLSVIDITKLHPAVLVSYMIMMYISVYPIAISLRRTNVYEEKSLGIYYNADPEEEHGDPNKEPSYVASHLRRQLGFDIWYIFLGLFIISIVEGSRIEKDPAFTLFGILFEVVSAYGTVGLSLGYPKVNTSFSGQFKVISKLVIIAMMIRGRHRGLPYSVDRAILLPSEALREKEHREATNRMRRRSSVISAANPPPETDTSRDNRGVATGWQHSPSGGPWTLGGLRSPPSGPTPRLPIHREEDGS